MKTYKLNPKYSKVLAYVKNTPEIRQAIKDWNKAKATTPLKLKPRGRGPNSVRQQVTRGGFKDAKLSKAPILAVYMLQCTPCQYTMSGVSWNVVRPSMIEMPAFLKTASKTLGILPIQG